MCAILFAFGEIAVTVVNLKVGVGFCGGKVSYGAIVNGVSTSGHFEHCVHLMVAGLGRVGNPNDCPGQD